MTVRLSNLWRLFGRRDTAVTAGKPDSALGSLPPSDDFDIAPDDPIIPLLQGASGSVEISRLELDSPALRALKAAGIHTVVPLVSQGELIGLIKLGPRRSAQEYSADDRALLNSLATHASPALRVAQLVRQQQAEARERERIAHELRVARLIQETLLPKEIPALEGWTLRQHYQPAREVGGDFYDYINLPNGKLAIVIADVTDKGIPAALVMATTRSILRTAAAQAESPGAVLERVNDLLYPDIPPNMFVTCLYAVLDPHTGHLCFANAGHDLPYWSHEGEVAELRARGMPLGLMPSMTYEEKAVMLAPGDRVLFYTDGLVEAHNSQREMFSFGRLQAMIEQAEAGGEQLIPRLLAALAEFTGRGAEQEDDITLVMIERAPASQRSDVGQEHWRTVGEFEIASMAGNERLAMRYVAEAASGFGLPERRLERLKTAVAEATMNAMEHGNHYREDMPVRLQVLASQHSLVVHVIDQGDSEAFGEPEQPDLALKIDGLQKPRGWGLFLMKHLVDEMRVTTEQGQHMVELVMYLKGERDAAPSI